MRCNGKNRAVRVWQIIRAVPAHIKKLFEATEDEIWDDIDSPQLGFQTESVFSQLMDPGIPLRYHLPSIRCAIIIWYVQLRHSTY